MELKIKRKKDGKIIGKAKRKKLKKVKVKRKRKPTPKKKGTKYATRKSRKA